MSDAKREVITALCVFPQKWECPSIRCHVHVNGSSWNHWTPPPYLKRSLCKALYPPFQLTIKLYGTLLPKDTPNLIKITNLWPTDPRFSEMMNFCERVPKYQSFSFFTKKTSLNVWNLIFQPKVSLLLVIIAWLNMLEYTPFSGVKLHWE